MASLTIFTPTYNRAYTLPKLYGSLCRQTCRDFKWLVVDDGSIDDTESVVSSWKEENKVAITYVKQPNCGKMGAHNKGVQMCDTEYFFSVDSDDYITDNAVEVIIQNLPKCSGNLIGGLVAYKSIGHEAAYQVLSHFPHLGYSTLGDLYKNGFKGDTSLVFKTHVLKKYPFPVVNGEKFITEAYVYDQIDREYMYWLVDEGLTYCEYMPDGYTNNDLMLHLKNPMGWCMKYIQDYDFSTDKKKRFHYSAQAYSYFLLYKERKYADKTMNFEIGSLGSRLYGIMLYVRRKIKYRKELKTIK